MTRVRGGAAAEQRLIDALRIIIDMAKQTKKWGLQDPRLSVENATDTQAVAEQALAFVEEELHQILVRRDKAAEDDIRTRLEALETWRVEIERYLSRGERGERRPLPLRRDERR